MEWHEPHTPEHYRLLRQAQRQHELVRRAAALGQGVASSRLLSDLGIDQRRWHDYHTGRLWMHEEEWASLALLLLDKQGP